MNQELSFETIPLELASGFPGEMPEVESERGVRRSFAVSRSQNLRSAPRPGLKSKGTKHSPLSRLRPALKGFRRPFGRAIYEPYPIAKEPYPSEPEPFGSERVRWVQDCLNQATGTQLPVTGIMGPETRRAVRNFQRQQGLRTSGIAGPDTEEALKTACAGQNAGENSELESPPIKEPGFIAWLAWQPRNEWPKLYTWDEIQKRPRNRIDGDIGVYIAVLFDKRNIGGKYKKIITGILKVGKATDSSFRKRLEAEDHKKMRARYPGKVGYYLAKIQASGACPIRGCATVVEHLIARTLIRAGKLMLPHHERPIVPIKAVDQIQVANILPKPLAKNLTKAYVAAGPKDVRGQKIQAVAAPVSGSGNLILPKDAIWELEGSFVPYKADSAMELEYPFSEAEEIELAAELLAVSNEEELDQFLGKLFKGIGRGFKKFGRFIGKKVLPAIGKGLKAIGKVALPVLGKALGSFIPIPGVGTAIGGALGTAVSKALELEFGGLPPEEAELEMARRFVRIAATAARQAALSDPHANPEAIANAALMAAARMHVPNLSVRAASSGAGLNDLSGNAGSGRWLRRDHRIAVMGV